jgi:tetratricopeptide (TPR) repeat protein
VLVALPFAWIAKQEQPDSTILFHPPFWARPLVMLDSFSFYLQKFIAPISLAADYTRTPREAMENGWIYYTWILPVTLAGLSYFKRKQWPWLGLGLGIFALGLLPASGIVSFQYQKFSTVADRYVYYAMPGLALIVAGIVDTLRSQTVRWMAAGPLAIFAILSSFQISVWADTETLLNHSLAHYPKSLIGHTNLGFYLHMRQRYDRAAYHFGQALELAGGDDPNMRSNYGAALGGIGEFDEAVKQLNSATESDPTNANAWYNLGMVHLKAQQPTRAVAALEKASELRPNVGPIRRQLETARELVRQSSGGQR